MRKLIAMKKFNNPIAEYAADVARERNVLDLSIQSLAEMVYVPVWLMKSIEEGTIHPTNTLKKRIADALEKYKKLIEKG